MELKPLHYPAVTGKVSAGGPVNSHVTQVVQFDVLLDGSGARGCCPLC